MKRLKLAFGFAALIIQAGSVEAQQTSSLDDFDSYMRNPGEWKRQQANQSDRRIQKKLLSNKPQKSSRIIDFRTATLEEMNACTRGQRQPLTPQPDSYSGYKKIAMWYDVNENGYPVNITAQTFGSGNGLIEMNSENDITQTKFYPPTLNGQKLFCKNIKEEFFWIRSGFISNTVIRQRANNTIERTIGPYD